jgi:rhamnogalacturonan acetylesterase
MKKYILAVVAVALAATAFKYQDKPTLFLIGDSTVKNGRDDGQNKGALGQWGWGHFLGDYFDSTKITVEDDALGGTSSRTFMNNPKLWATVLAKIKPGDFVMMQFGANDASAINDSTRARGTFKNNSDTSVAIHNMLTKQDEVVHSFGWYLRKFISDAKAKGATSIVCSLIPRNNFKDGKVNRANNGYGLWSKQAAEQGGASFLPLNDIIADDYDKEGPAAVTATYFTAPETLHTNEAGAKFNATAVVMGIKGLKDSKLKEYLKN